MGMKNNMPLRLGAAGAVAAVCAVLAVWSSRWSGGSAANTPATGDTPNAPNTADLIGEWRAAVLAGEPIQAISLAKRAIAPAKPKPPYQVEEALCADNGINPAYLRAGFNKWDFQLWNDALFFKKLSDDIIAKAKGRDPVEALFDAVRARVKPVESSKGAVLWPRTIWSLGEGFCDRQAWVLCELAWQAGFDTVVVYLKEPGKPSPHTVCEIWGPKGEKWLADPFSGKLLKGRSMADLAGNPDLAEEIWPERKDWWNAVAGAVRLIPAYPQDFCWRNQALSAIVTNVLGDDSPRFGTPPWKRIQLLSALTGHPASKFQLWPYPFRLLRAQMARSAAKVRNGHPGK